MLSETLQAIIITAIVAPISLELLRFIFGLIGNSKQKAVQKSEAQDLLIRNLEKRIDTMRDDHKREIEGLRASLERDYSTRYELLHKDIETLRSENVKLQILVAENAVKLTLKDETIARLSSNGAKPTKGI